MRRKPSLLLLLCVLLCIACSRSMVLSDYGTRLGISRADDGSAVARRRPHDGVDIRANRRGDPAIASAPGVVLRVGYSQEAGYSVLITHRHFGRWTMYSHLETVTVEPFQSVSRGQPIGTVGLFPYSGGVIHVHWKLCTRFGCHGDDSDPLAGTEDPLSISMGCYEPSRSYPTDQLMLTYPVRCR